MILANAIIIASRLVKDLMPACERIQVVGSVRRGKPAVKDLDVLVIPGTGFLPKVMTLGKTKLAGQKIIGLTYHDPVETVDVQLFVADEKTWATLLLIRTGSAAFNKNLAIDAKRKGYSLKASGIGVVNSGGNLIASHSEAAIIEACGLKYREPWQREIPLSLSQQNKRIDCEACGLVYP